MAVGDRAAERAPRIFVSYEREDVCRYVLGLHDRLLRAFGRDGVFMDTGAVRTRAEFSTVINEALVHCDVLLALIGRNWLGDSDGRDSKLAAPGVLGALVGRDLVKGIEGVPRGRLPARGEFVRLELESAFRHGVEVIPVLLDGAQMPTRQALPKTIARLASEEPRHLSTRRWRADVDVLAEELKILARSKQRYGPRRAPTQGRKTPKEVCRVAHERPLTSVAFSEDGMRLVTGSGDKTARVWDATSGQELRRLSHNRFVRSVAYSLDGTRLATGTGDRWGRVWDPIAGIELLSVNHKDPWFVLTKLRGVAVSSVAYSPDGSRLLTATQKSAWVWDANTGDKLLRIVHRGIYLEYVHAVAFSPDGTRVATACDDKTARVWDAATGEELLRVVHEAMVASSVRSVAFSPDGNRLATGGDDKTARLWDAATGEELFRVPHKDRVGSVAFSPDGARLAMGSWGAAEVWDAVMGGRLFRVNHEDRPVAVAFSPDGARLATAGSRTARVWQL